MKDDPDFNIQLVSVIEKNPCIYDYNTKEYSCRITQEKAWENVGKEVKSTASECKERWKNLRACYTRHLKQKLPSGSSAKVKRAYYLAENMNFLESFTKSRRQTGNIPVTFNSIEINSSEMTENFSENELDNSDEQVADDYEFPNEMTQSTSKKDFISPSASNVKTYNLKKKHASVLLEDVNKAALDFFFKKKKTESDEDMDLCFLKSLLPDMKIMTPDQKRRYKMQMINIAGNILSEPTVNNQNQTYPFVQRQYTDYTGSTDKRPHSNSSAKTSSSTSSLSILSDNNEIQNERYFIQNQQRNHVLKSKGYYSTDMRPNSIASNISASSETSLNMPMVECQQDNINLGSVVLSPNIPQSEHQTHSCSAIT